MRHLGCARSVTLPLSALLAGAMCMVAPRAGYAQATLGPPISAWSPNGTVAALTLDGPTLYVGGRFDQVGPRTGSFVVADAADPTAISATSTVAGDVYRVVADGAGGWFVMAAIAETILHVLPSGARDPGWTSPTFDSNALSMAADGGRLFVAGGFRTVNGVPRAGLAALDSTGAVLPWNPQLVSTDPLRPTPIVYPIAAMPGRLYISGFFDQAGGAARRRFAILDTVTGNALPGALPATFGDALSILLSPTRVYIQGRCNGDGTTVCAYTPDLTPLAGWVFPAAEGPLALGPSALFAVEFATNPSGGPRVVALDLDTGAPLQRATVAVSGGVRTMAVGGNTLYVGGDFTQVNGKPRLRVAAIDASDGTLRPWAPPVGGTVTVLSAYAGSVAIGGQFHSAGGVAKRNLIAIDLGSGRQGPATPDPEVSVEALLKVGDVMVVGGFRPAPSTGPDLTAFHAPTGVPLPWSMTSDGQILALASDGARLYVGGRYLHLSGVPRPSLAAVDLGTGALTSWNPSPNGAVTTLSVSGSALFAAGEFSTLTGFARAGKAAFETASGAVLSFNPTGDLYGLRGLGFYQQGVLLARQRYFGDALGPLAWADRVSGEQLRSSVQVRLNPWSVAQSGNSTFVVGTDFANGAAQLAILDAASGLARHVPLPLSGFVNVVAASTDYVAVGGVDVLSLFTGAANSLAVFRAPRSGAPQRLTASVANAVVSLGWTPGDPPAATSFSVEAGTSFGATDVGVFSVGLATSVSGVLPPGTYFTRVRGVGTAGTGAVSSEVIVTVPSTSTPPNAPGVLSATVSAGIVTLSWGAASGNATTYLIEAGTASGLTNIGTLPTGGLDTFFSTPAPAGTYFVRVRSANAFGAGPPSNEVTVVVP